MAAEAVRDFPEVVCDTARGRSPRVTTEGNPVPPRLPHNL